MTTVQPMHFDLGTNESGKGVIYVIGDDTYLYIADLKQNPDEMVWVKSKKPAPAPLSWASIMKVYNNVVYLSMDNIFCVTNDFGENWQSYPIYSDSNYYNLGIYVDDNSIMLGGSENTVIKSSDGGQTWNYIDNGYPIQWPRAITSNGKFIAVGGYSELMVSLQGNDKWYHFSNATVGDKYLSSYITNIIFEDRYSFIYLIQDDGISYGEVLEINGDVVIKWKSPFTNIKDYSGIEDSTYMVLGYLILFGMYPNDLGGNYPGKFRVYNIDGYSQRPFVSEREVYSNPFAQLGENTESRLRRLDQQGWAVYLSDAAVLSASYNSATWQQLIVNVPGE